MNWFARVTTKAPVITEPPPDKSKRRAKEEHWLNSIRRSRDKAAPASVLSNASKSNSSALEEHGTRVLVVQSTALVPKSSNAPLAPPGPPLTHKRSFLSRKKSSSTIRCPKEPELAKIEEPYLVVRPDGGVEPEPPVTLPLPHISGQDSSASPTGLGVRLQELSSANEAGLLDDQEYRALRQVIFQKFSEQAAQPAPPKEPSLHLNAMPTTLLTPTRNASPARPASLRSDAHSMHSVKSTMSSISHLLRPQKSKRKEEWESLHRSHQSRDSRDASSISHTADDVDSVYAPSYAESTDLDPERRISLLPPLPSRASMYSNTFNDPFVRRGRLSSSSAASFLSTSTSGRKAGRPRQLSSAGSSNSHGWETDDDYYSSARSSELKHEIALLDAERTRILDQYSVLEDLARNKYLASERLRSDSQSLTTDSDSTITRVSMQSRRFSIPRTSITSDYPSLKPPVETTSLTSGVASDEASQSFFETLEKLKTKRARVQSKYNARIEYLRVREQGAKLRESLSQ